MVLVPLRTRNYGKLEPFLRADLEFLIFPQQPHEDGPTYHPVVATLSLGSHATFHYYQYRTDDCLDGSNIATSGGGRSIDKTPTLSVLLEPRSLVVTTSSLYTSHLHGIDELEEDVFLAPGSESAVSQFTIANVDLLGEEKLKEAVVHGGVLRRETRYSLTCRDVERVARRFPFRKP